MEGLSRDAKPGLAAAAGPSIAPGEPWPLGARVDERGINFAVFSAHAEAIDLCLFDDAGTREVARLRLPGRSGDVWHGRLEGARAGLVYGLRAHGPWQPDAGHRFNPAKLLLDPYAREIVGHFDWADPHFGADLAEPYRQDTRDNAATALKARVVDDRLDRADRIDRDDDRAPRTALDASVLYELHVKGFSKLNPAVPEALRGTFAGLGHAASIAHLKTLGITAVSLLPVHQCIDEERLVRMGLTNYWGYNTIGFFALEPRLSCTPHDGAASRAEFREMVRALHAAGIEVMLDVVFNHTAESEPSGPTISFKGLDNASYYRLQPGALADYENFTGCGNTVDLRHPRVLQLVMDSLRYWVESMHVDGFRFDLAPVLGRTNDGFSRRAAFFQAVAQDPLLASVKMIAEPWDIGAGGYQTGGFPAGWAEWNDRFRDDMRAFWLRHPSTRGAFAQRLSGSSDLFRTRGRRPAESINYVVSHDGFTLHDLLAYAERHNLANGEDNRDGSGHNFSFNAGVEGPTDDAKVNALRGRLKRALLATALLAQGTPMLCAGDELGHTQGGNNNPYCHDSEVTWIDWARADADLIAFTAEVCKVRRTLRPFPDRWYDGNGDLAWLDPRGNALRDEAWGDATARVLGCLIAAGSAADETLLFLVNGGADDAPFTLPAGEWRVLLETTGRNASSLPAARLDSTIDLAASSLVLLSCRAPSAAP